MKTAKLALNQISKTFFDKNEETPVIKDFSCSINERECVAILGPSGCGKSTLLKIAAGIIPASSGNILLDGQDFGVEIPREQVHRIGFVFQSHNLLQWRTAEGNLRLMLEVMKLEGPEWENRINEMLELVGLLKYKDVFPHELSGGMKQRVGIARALVHNPEILIMDQSFGALDAITRRLLSFETLRILRQTQKTLLTVTNRIDEAVLLADRVIVLSNKPLVAVGEVKIDIPFESRNQNIFEDKTFLNYCAEIDAMVRIN